MIHRQDVIKFSEVLIHQLPRLMPDGDSITLCRFNGARIGLVTKVIVPCAAGVGFNTICQLMCGNFMFKNSLGQGRPANIAQTNEKYFHAVKLISRQVTLETILVYNPA